MNEFSWIHCPKCKGPVTQHGTELRCGPCSISYPVTDGIPVMLPDLESADLEQDLRMEKEFYEEMFSDLKGFEDGHCIVYGQERIYEFMEQVERGTVLEAGCGGGHHSVNLSRRGFDVTSMDISLNGLRAARRLAEHEGEAIRFLCGDIKRLPFEDKQFDICFCSLILHHFKGLENIIKELSRVTRRTFVAYEVNAHDPVSYLRFNILNPLVGVKGIVKNQRALFPATLAGTLSSNGFRDVRIKYDDVHDYIGKAPRSMRARMIRSFQAVMKAFPEKYSKNKFFVLAQRQPPRK